MSKTLSGRELLTLIFLSLRAAERKWRFRREEAAARRAGSSMVSAWDISRREDSCSQTRKNRQRSRWRSVKLPLGGNIANKWLAPHAQEVLSGWDLRDWIFDNSSGFIELVPSFQCSSQLVPCPSFGVIIIVHWWYDFNRHSRNKTDHLHMPASQLIPWLHICAALRQAIAISLIITTFASKPCIDKSIIRVNLSGLFDNGRNFINIFKNSLTRIYPGDIILPVLY